MAKGSVCSPIFLECVDTNGSICHVHIWVIYFGEEMSFRRCGWEFRSKNQLQLKEFAFVRSTSWAFNLSLYYLRQWDRVSRQKCERRSRFGKIFVHEKRHTPVTSDLSTSNGIKWSIHMKEIHPRSWFNWCRADSDWNSPAVLLRIHCNPRQGTIWCLLAYSCGGL